MFYIRQGATHKVVIGPVVAVGDGFTPVTNLDVGTSDEAEAIKHDNGTVVDISGYTWAAIATADGYYHLTLHADISGTVGHLTIVINDDSLCLPVRADFTILEEVVYDAMYAASAAGPLQSTTAARKLDVTATGAAGIDWANVENPTTAVNLSATNIKTDQKVDVNTIKTQTVTCGAGVTIYAYVGTPAVPGAAGGAFIAGTNAETTITTALNANLTGDITGNLSGSVGSVTTKTGFSLADGSIVAATFAANALVAATFAASSLNGKGDWNTTTPDASGTAAGLHSTTDGKIDAVKEDTAEIVTQTAAILDDTSATIPTILTAIGGYVDCLPATLDGSTLTNLPNVTTDGASRTASKADVEDVYHADIYLTIDEANTQDEYTVVWFKNGVRITSGITVPKIQVVKRSDGTDLIASSDLTQIGATGAYKKDEALNRLTAGEAVIGVVTATIDASSRSFAAVVGRDSSS